VQLLQRIVSKHRETAIGATRLDALTSAVDIHTDLFISVAFSRDYADEKWMKARKASRELIKALLISDTEDLAKAITVLCVCNVQDTVVSVPAVHHELWTKVYGATSSKDQEASGMLLGVVSRIAHQDILSDHAFGKAIERTKDATTALHAVNAGLISLRNGFRAMISGFAEDNSPSILATFLRQPGTVKNLVALLMSPVDDYQFSIAMVEQAYDVDGRRDSFRALFNHMPDQSYDGVFFCLERITAFIPTVPEACKLSKAVVNCLTDIIDALSSRLDGLFQTESHLAQADRSRSPASNISQLWAYMAKMSTAIFSRTPKWSRYFEDERDMMIGWMRDAMIFGRDMVAQRRSFASAILSSRGATVG
jgi:senataxin